MIDWYNVLFLGVSLIIFSLDIIADHRVPLAYFTAGRKLGIQKGTVLLCVSLFTEVSLLIPILIVYHAGLIKSLFFSAGILFVIYWLMIDFLDQIEDSSEYQHSLFGFYQQRFTAVGFRIFWPLLVFANTYGLILQLTIAHKLFSVRFSQSSISFVVIIVVFSLITAGLGGMLTIYKISNMLLILSGFALLFVPLYFFLKEGINQIFNQYFLFKYPENSFYQMFMWLITAILIIIGNFVTNLYQWEVLSAIKSNHRSSAIKLSIFCSASVPVAIIIYSVYILSKYHPFTISQYVAELMNSSNNVIVFMIVVVWITGCINSLTISFFSLVFIFFYSFSKKRNIFERIKVKQIYVIAIILSVCTLLIQLWIIKYMALLLILYVLFFISISLPLWSVIRSRRTLPFWVPLWMIGTWVTGQLLFIFKQNLDFTLKACIILSMGNFFAVIVFNIVKKDNILQK